jgi:hypothetical protein
VAGHPALIGGGMFKNVFQIAYVTWLPDELAASLGETRLFYADTTKLLDHYQEYAWVDSQAEQFMATLPRN